MSKRTDWGLEDYQNRFAELRSALGELSDKDRNSDDYRSTFSNLKAEREVLDQEFHCLRASEYQAQQESRSAGYEVGSVGQVDYRSAGEIVVNDEAMAQWLAHSRKGNSPVVEMRGRFADQWRMPWQDGYEYRTLVDDSTGTTALLLPKQQPRIPEQTYLRKKLFIRDVLAGGRTTNNSVTYVVELNAVANEGAASTVAPAGTKPEATIEFDDVLDKVTTIAVTLPLTNQTLEDNAVVVSYINNRLSYMLDLRDEQQLLTGTGVGADLNGIMNRSGVQTQAATSGEMAITIANAIAKIEIVGGYPNAVAMSSSNYWAMVTKRAAGGSGTFDAGDPFTGVPATVWGLPIVRTQALATNHALVGDFQLGAQVFDRSTAEIRFFEQHSDYAAKNKTLVRAEQREALAVYRPDWFVDVTLA